MGRPSRRRIPGRLRCLYGPGRQDKDRGGLIRLPEFGLAVMSRMPSGGQLSQGTERPSGQCAALHGSGLARFAWLR